MPRGVRKRLRRNGEGLLRLFVAWKRPSLGNIEGGTQQRRRIFDQGQVLILVLRHEACQRRRAGDHGNSVEAPRHGLRVLQRGSKDINSVERVRWVAHELEQRCDRFDLCAPQAQGIEREFEIIEERQARHDRHAGEKQDRDPVARHETVDGSELAVANLLGLPRRPR